MFLNYRLKTVKNKKGEYMRFTSRQHKLSRHISHANITRLKKIRRDLKTKEYTEICPGWSCILCSKFFPRAGSDFYNWKYNRTKHPILFFRKCPCGTYSNKYLINIINAIINCHDNRNNLFEI